MELNVNLLEREKKSYIRLGIGLVFIILTIIWIVIITLNNWVVKPYEWLNIGICALNGIAHTLYGFGSSIERLFGKAFILIDKEKIAVKIDPFEKEQNALWNDVKSIESKPSKLMVIKTDNTNLNIDFSNLDYALVQNIKKSIHGFAEEKGF